MSSSLNKVRVGVIGLGAWGRTHAEILHSLPHVELRTVCDVVEERAREVARSLGLTHWTTRFEDVAADPHIDAVTVVTPEADHLAPVMAALSNGKHVLVEKPMALTAAEARQMVEAARKANVFLMPGHCLRFEPRCVLLRQAVARGELGRVVSVFSRRNRPRSLYPTYQRIHPAYELAVHDIDLILWLVGRRVSRVTAFERNVQGGRNPDVLWAFLEFESGAVATVENSWLVPDEAGVALDDLVEVIGEKGKAGIDLSHQGLWIWNASGSRMPEIGLEPRLHGYIGGAIRDELVYFTTCVLHGHDNGVLSAVDGVHGIEVIEAIIRSAREGQAVTLDSPDASRF